MVGRLKPEATIEEAQTEMTVLARQLEAAFPDTNKGRGVRVYPARGSRVNEQARTASDRRATWRRGCAGAPGGFGKRRRSDARRAGCDAARRLRFAWPSVRAAVA